MNFRLHILGLSMIVVLALIALVASGRIKFGEPPVVVDAVQSDSFVQIESASWGLNCHNRTMKRNEAGLPLIRFDNVLKGVSSLCNGQELCTIPIDPKVLGEDPLSACSKELVVEYRCTSLDRLRRAKVEGEDKPLKIDCRTNVPAPVEPANGTAEKASPDTPQ